MTWLETDPVTERKRFIMEWLSGEFSVSELCCRHEISRKRATSGSTATNEKVPKDSRTDRAGRVTALGPRIPT